jgi:hypothetical protein
MCPEQNGAKRHREPQAVGVVTDRQLTLVILRINLKTDASLNADTRLVKSGIWRRPNAGVQGTCRSVLIPERACVEHGLRTQGRLTALERGRSDSSPRLPAMRSSGEKQLGRMVPPDNCHAR